MLSVVSHDFKMIKSTCFYSYIRESIYRNERLLYHIGIAN